MLKQQENIFNLEDEYRQIASVKECILNIHESGNFFSLSLKSLELIRRFNNLYTEVIENGDTSPSNLNQLIITSKGLESELIQIN